MKTTAQIQQEQDETKADIAFAKQISEAGIPVIRYDSFCMGLGKLRTAGESEIVVLTINEVPIWFKFTERLVIGHNIMYRYDAIEFMKDYRAVNTILLIK